jgi:ABC-type branched-subunit amino acid transport system permease subunit
MSEEVSFWAKMAEKLLGIILVVVSIMMIYFTATSTDVLKGFTGFFGFLSAIILIIGAFLIVVKIPE